MSYDWESRDYILLNREGSTNLPAVPSSDMQGQLFVDRDAGPPDLLKLVRLNAAGTGYEYAVLNRPLVAGSSNIVVTNGDAVAGDPTVDLGQFVSLGGGTPTPSTKTGAGTTATISVTQGKDCSGDLDFTPGGTGIASGAQFRLTFGVALPLATYRAWLIPRNAAAAAVQWNVGTRATGSVEFNFIAAPTSGTLYAFSWVVLG